MELPAYLLVLWRFKLLVVASAVLAVIVATAVHFSVTDEGLTLRGDREHSAAVTVLLGGGPKNPYAAQIPGVERVPGVEEDQIADLSNTAVIYAYLASGEAVRSAVVAQAGPLREGDSVGAVRRTTQPRGDESNGGRFTLPFLSVVGTSFEPDRAVELSRAATTALLDRIAQEQDAQGVPEAIRVTLTVTDEGEAVPGPLGTVAVPIAATGLATFLIAVLGILLGDGIRRRRSSAPPVRRRSWPEEPDLAAEIESALAAENRTERQDTVSRH
ncbi:hypothetical protein [Rathayibacter sp. VKM Ac-2760]|uniref:hypothetical protein n=1 Tax=Rathayibacter sp. VKM Ac-2760 TaxID=2609253 RepID=UPI0013177CA6|nr:hypothetical protein [Rathayibacter sp. VKM Ac-2760]QHC59591.1 hypothetical protein GSU72_14285 [Rathayibacter sp. VKM Ac-2760]